MNNITTLVRQIESMHERLSHLYLQASDTAIVPLEILPLALKELGPTAETLQIAKETLQQRREQEDQQSRFGCTSQAQLITNLDGKIEAVNSAAAQLLRMSASDLVGQALSRFLVADQRHRFYLSLKQLQQSAQPQEWVSELHPHRGKQLDLVFSITPLRGSDDKLTQIHWTLQNAVALRSLLNESSQRCKQDDPQHLTTSAAGLEGSCYRYEKGDVIPLNSHTICYVHEGVVRLSTLTVSNEEVVLGWVGAAMPFTASSANLLTYQAIALTSVRLAKIPLSEVQSDFGLAQLLLPKLQYRLQQAEALLNISGQRRTEDRMYALLQFLRREFGESIASGEKRINVRFTHENLANACCTTRVTVTRILSKFQQAGKLRFDSKSYMILSENF